MVQTISPWLPANSPVVHEIYFRWVSGRLSSLGPPLSFLCYSLPLLPPSVSWTYPAITSCGQGWKDPLAPCDQNQQKRLWLWEERGTSQFSNKVYSRLISFSNIYIHFLYWKCPCTIVINGPLLTWDKDGEEQLDDLWYKTSLSFSPVIRMVRNKQPKETLSPFQKRVLIPPSVN